MFPARKSRPTHLETPFRDASSAMSTLGLRRESIEQDGQPYVRKARHYLRSLIFDPEALPALLDLGPNHAFAHNKNPIFLEELKITPRRKNFPELALEGSSRGLDY